ncbi:zinc-ribbon domain-containing protein [Demequina globuliformis]|uniref:zinc-ribbon domain-containing protein n=1 Tax=Demequina globuliformis TaxID=676202 RepID=UPI0034E2B977
MLLRFAVGERLTEQGLVIEVDPICSAFSAPRSAKFSALAADFARWLAAVDAATLRQSSIRDLYCASPGAASAPGASVWVCDAGHGLERTAPPAWSRRRTFPCQVCSGDRAVEGINSLADSDPDTAAQWCYEHNGQLLPSDVTRGEKRLVCRICDAGHHSPATVINLVSASGCRLCHRERPYCGAQSVARAAPNLLRWWHPTRNLPVTPQSASAATSTLRWWTCAEGHAFEQSVASRRRCARGGEGQCLVCTRRRLQVGINDLTTAEPAIALDWDDDENPTLACRTLANPMRKGVWRCRFGHVVSTTIHDRVVTGGCKLCAPSFRVGRPNTRAGDASKAARHPERVFLAFDDPADVAPERDLTNIEWTAVETYMVSVFPGSRRERRLVLDAILWVHRRGGRWMDLPQRYGPPSTPHLWWRRLCEHDEWRTIVDTLEGLADDASSCDAIAKELAEQQGHYVEVSIA